MCYPPKRPTTQTPPDDGSRGRVVRGPANAYNAYGFTEFLEPYLTTCLPRDPSTTHSALASTTGSRFGRGRTARARPASRAPVLLVRSDDFNLPASARLQRDEASTGSVGAPSRDENSGRSPYRPGRSRAKCEGRPSNSQTRPVNSSRWMLPPLLRTTPCADVVPPLSEM